MAAAPEFEFALWIVVGSVVEDEAGVAVAWVVAVVGSVCDEDEDAGVCANTNVPDREKSITWLADTDPPLPLSSWS